MRSLKFHFIVAISSVVAVVVVSLTSLHLFLHSKNIHENAYKSLRMSGRQMQLNISDKLKGYLTTLSNISKSKAVKKFLIDHSTINTYDLEYYLNQRSILEHKPLYSIVNTNHKIMWKSDTFSFDGREISDILLSSQRKIYFKKNNNNTKLLLLSPIFYKKSIEGYIVAELEFSELFTNLLTKVEQDYSMSMHFNEEEIFSVRETTKNQISLPIEGADGFKITVSISDKLTHEPIMQALKVLFLSGTLIFILSIYLVVYFITPRYIAPFEQLGVSISKLEKTEGQIVNIESNILEVNVLQDRFNKMLRKLDRLYKDSMSKAHKAGMAEISISVLHNIGNIVTGLSLKCHHFSAVPNLIKVRKILSGVTDSISGHLETGTLEDFLLNDPKGVQYLKAMKVLSSELEQSTNSIGTFTDFLHTQINHMGEIISSQQNLASGNIGIASDVNIKFVIEDALKLLEDRFHRHNINLWTSLEDVEVVLDKYGFSQVIVNFYINSIESILELKRTHRDHVGAISTRIYLDGLDVIIEISDNGVGIDPKVSKNLFTFGFSTKNRQSGFGLHNCANFVKANGGKIDLTSAGINKGAKSILKFPLAGKKHTTKSA